MSEGKKLCTNAPSPKILRKRLGNLKAAKKMSENIPAPSIWAVKISRKKPKMREHKIPLLFVKKAFFSKNPLSKYQ